MIDLAILGCARWLVPREQRAEWFAEWKAELWYVRSQNRGGVAFSLGAFHDALWIRWNSPSPLRFESPLQCLLFLAILAAGTLLLATRAPMARDLLRPSPYPDAAELVMISAHRHHAPPAPTIPIQQFDLWTSVTGRRFERIAFYRPILTPVATTGHKKAELRVAWASDHLFDILKIPMASVPPGADGRPAFILSRRAWRRFFGGDPHVVGRAIEISGEPAVVSGVLDENSWRLPGQVDGWLLEDREHLARLPADSPGFVLARLRLFESQHHHGGLWHTWLPNQEGSLSDYDCVSVAERMPDLFGAFLFMVVGAWLVVRIAPRRSHGERLHRFRRWAFFSAKIALLLPIAVFGALDLAYLIASIVPIHIEGPALGSAWILAVGWVLRDQQQRCPVCLRLLINPVGIGQASQTFLGWYGTEFMCAKGHGVLHVPEIPMSSSSTTRWIELDPTWSGLF